MKLFTVLLISLLVLLVDAQQVDYGDDNPFCNICGYRQMITLPEAEVPIPVYGTHTCEFLHQKSKDGKVPRQHCSILQAFSRNKCGCAPRTSPPTPAPTESPAPSISAAPSVSSAPTPSPTESPSVSMSPTPSPTPAPTSSPTESPSVSMSPTPGPTPAPEASVSAGEAQGTTGSRPGNGGGNAFGRFPFRTGRGGGRNLRGSPDEGEEEEEILEESK